jgi:hypothetical protein
VVAAAFAAVVLFARPVARVAYRFWYGPPRHVERVVMSPDGARAATLTSNNEETGGATSEYALDVDISYAHGRIPLALITTALWVQGTDHVAMRWAGPRQLVIEIPTHADVQDSRSQVGDVGVTVTHSAALDPAWSSAASRRAIPASD